MRGNHMNIKKVISLGIVSFVLPVLLCGCACHADEPTDQEPTPVEPTLKQLDTPTNVRVEADEHVYWNEVPNSASYVLRINSYQQDVGNALNYSISSIIDSHIGYDIETTLHIAVKAKGNQITFLDSEWSSEITYNYTKRDESSPQKESLLPPADIACVNNVITWTANAKAFGYEICFNNDAEFVKTTTSTSYDVSRLFVDAVEFTFQIRCIALDHETYNNSAWSNAVTASIKEDGTQAFPYLIPDSRRFYQYFGSNAVSSSEGKYYRITQDFNLNGVDCLEVPLFKGYLDGDGHSVNDISLGSVNDEYAPTYYVCWIIKNYGTIVNLNFVRPKLKASYNYDSDQQRVLRTGMIAENYGTISNVKVLNGNFDSQINEINEAAGHDASPVLLSGALCSYNKGIIDRVTIKDTKVKGYANAENNKGSTYSCVGGLIGTNDDGGTISNCLTSNITISSEGRGGYYVFLQGGGQVYSWASYMIGNNAGLVSKCVTYKHSEDSLSSKATALADYMGVENFYGLVAGRSSGTYEDVYAVKTNNVSNFQGSDTSALSDHVKTTINEVSDTITSWDYWSIVNGELVIS